MKFRPRSDDFDIRPVVDCRRARQSRTNRSRRVQLYGRDAAAARREGGQDVRAAARADDERLGVWRELEWERAVPILHLRGAGEVAVPGIDARPGVGVNVQPREVRSGESLDAVNARVGIPSGLCDAGAGRLVHLAAHGF